MDLTHRRLLHNISALTQINAEISSTHDFEEVVRSSLYALLGTLAIPKGAIARFTDRPRQLKVIAAKGYPRALGQKIALEEKEAQSLCSLAAPLVITAEQNGLAELADRSRQAIRPNGSCIAVPMVVRGQLLGLIFLSEKFSGDPYTADDIEIINAIAGHIGIALFNHRLIVSFRRRAEENKRMYRQMRQVFLDTVRAFGAAIDLKDTYTSGHSDRVARYAEAIAREMGVTGQELEYIGVVGYLHDIGKIVVDRSIINNPRQLTEKEFREMNRHAITGYEILSRIPRPWQDIAHMVRCHHEKFDGRGYPDQLKGDQIPLGARVVTLADSFDAMMTDRPYRTRLPLKVALEELRSQSGKHFDPACVAAFSRVLLKEINGMARRRVLLPMIGANLQRASITRQLCSIISEVDKSTDAASRALSAKSA